MRPRIAFIATEASLEHRRLSKISPTAPAQSFSSTEGFVRFPEAT
jgi:hypothetical protein